MQVTETQNEGLKRGYEITMTAAELAAKVDEKLEAARPEVQMKGFRKGKVPMALLKKQFGQSVMGEAMQEGIDDALKAHFEETGDRPAAQPNVQMKGENWKEGDDVVVSVSYEALPEINEPSYGDLTVEKLVAEVEDDAVDEALANLAESTQNFEKRRKGSKAKDGDQVTIDFLGKVDGEAFEGGAAEDYPLVLGSNSFIPGFEDQLVGVKEGDEKDVEVTFPEEYQAAHLAGKAAVFTVNVKQVAEPKAAEINDELATKFGMDDLDALKGQLRERLAAEYAGASRTVTKRNLLDALDGAVSFELPPSMVEAEAGQIAHQLWHEENPDVQGHDHEKIEPTDEHNALAERRVKLGLLLAEVGQKNEVTVSDQEMQQAVFRQAQQYPGQEKAFFDFVQSNQQALQQIRAPLFEDKVVDYMLELVKVEEKTVSKEDLQKAIEDMDEE
ncbi:trigger factor [Pontivivens insulae]|uniref:Trigger factor n=1 Tax=Pontivivens insulae TaxID=1639689 RepID=A0A2R8AB69_9RHOB|nr:trigger factor [Pontivivens insulae]RED11353.1 trigger factor [Pontivivens insulae]SPF29474.1 Trigger factor [Pontivivens insulae]